MTFRSGPPGSRLPAEPTSLPRSRRIEPHLPSKSAAADRRETLVRRVRAEFFEMPGMRLTVAQAQRLFGLPNDLCEWILAELTREGFLSRTHNGMFARREFSRG